MPAKPPSADEPAGARRALAEDRDRQQQGEHRREERDRRALGERDESQPAEEASRRDHQAQRARELHAQVARAPEARPVAVPGDRRRDQHLPGVARPDDQEERVVADEELGRGVERAEAKAGEERM